MSSQRTLAVSSYPRRPNKTKQPRHPLTLHVLSKKRCEGREKMEERNCAFHKHFLVGRHGSASISDKVPNNPCHYSTDEETNTLGLLPVQGHGAGKGREQKFTLNSMQPQSSSSGS